VAGFRSLKGLLVDFDGTLVDLPTDYEGMRRDLRAAFGGYGRDRPFRPLLDSLAQIRGELLRDGVPPAEVSTRMYVAEGVVTRYEEEAAGNARARGGAGAFLEEVKKRSLSVAIVTNNGRSAVDKAFQLLQLPRPDFIVARGEAERFKPMPEPAIKALALLRMEPRDVLLVGDDERDYAMGLAAGIETVLVGGRVPGATRVATLLDVIGLLGPSP